MAPPARPPTRGATRGATVAMATALALTLGCDLGPTSAGASGGGCVRVHQGDYTFPVKRILRDSLAVRVTQHGADFLTEHLRQLVLAFFDADEDGQALVPLDALGLGDLSTELGPFSAQLTDVVVTLDLSSLTVAFVPGSNPARLRVTATDVAVGLASGVVAGSIDTALFQGDVACGLASGAHPTSGGSYVALLSFELVLELATGDAGALDAHVVSLTVDTHDVALDVVTDCTLDACLDGLTPPDESECGECKTVCGAADVASNLVSLFQELLDNVIDQLVSWLADDIANALLDALMNGKPIAVEGTLDTAALGGALLPYLRTATPLGVVGRPGDAGFAITCDAATAGLTVRLDAGVDAAQAHPCVGDPGADPPFTPSPAPPFPLLAPRPGSNAPDGAAYHVGLALSDALVNEALWAAWKSGALCIDLTTQDLATLSSGLTRAPLTLTARTLELLLPGVARIAGPDAPVRLRLRPHLDAHTPAVTQFGGTPAAPDADLTVRLTQATVAIEVSVGDHFLRVLSFRADLLLAVAVDPVAAPASPSGPSRTALGLRVADVGLEHLTVPEGQLYAAADYDLIAPFVVDLALGVLSDLPLTLEVPTVGLVPDATGLPIEAVIVDVRPAGDHDDWLQILVALEEPAPPPAPSAEMVSLGPSGPGWLAFHATAPERAASGAAAPSVQLRVGAGAWSQWFQPGDHVLEHPRLWGVGEHVITARLRAPGGLPGPPFRVGVALTAAPEATLSGAPVAPAGAPDGAPTPAQGVGAAGASSSGVDGGCDAGGTSGPGPAVALVLLAALAWRRARQRPGRVGALGGAISMSLTLAVPALGAVLIATLMVGAASATLPACTDTRTAPPLACDGHDQCPDGFLCGPDGTCVVATTCETDATCCPGAECFHGWCRPTSRCGAGLPAAQGGTVPANVADCPGVGDVCEDQGGVSRCVPKPCQDDTDCPADARCFAGRCLDTLPCDGACGPDAGCHVPSGRCVAAPACADLACPAGQVAVVGEADLITPYACTDPTLPCVCEALPAVPLGTPGFDAQLAATEDTPTALSYDPVYGDLVRSRLALDGTVLEHEAVDGVPDGPVVGAVDGARGGVAEPGPDRGQRPAVAVGRDSAGQQVVDVLYRDADTKGVRFMRLDGATGAVRARAALPVQGDAGRFSCLTHDPHDGSPVGLVFVARDAQDRVSQLMRVRAAGRDDATLDAVGWAVSVLRETPLPARSEAPCDDACGPLELCVLAPPAGGGEPAPTCVSGLEGWSCPEGCGPHEVCAHLPADGAGADAAPAEGGAGGGGLLDPGTCVPRIYRRSRADRLPFGAGLFVTCAASPAAAGGGLTAAWYDADHGALWAEDTPWGAGNAALVDGDLAPAGATDVGRHARLVVAPGGRQAIAYQDTVAGALKLAERAGPGLGGGPWEISTVLSGQTASGAYDLGAWPALAFDRVGDAANPGLTVAFADTTRGNILLAHRDETDCWKSVEVYSDGTWVEPGLVAAPGGDVWLSALRLGFDDTLRPTHTLTLRRIPTPRCTP